MTQNHDAESQKGIFIHRSSSSVTRAHLRASTYSHTMYNYIHARTTSVWVRHCLYSRLSARHAALSVSYPCFLNLLVSVRSGLAHLVTRRPPLHRRVPGSPPRGRPAQVVCPRPPVPASRSHKPRRRANRRRRR